MSLYRDTMMLVHALSVIWWSLAEWLRDYERFGVDPGVSNDAKSLANLYVIPLVTLNGKANKCKNIIYAMGFYGIRNLIHSNDL